MPKRVIMVAAIASLAAASPACAESKARQSPHRKADDSSSASARDILFQNAVERIRTSMTTAGVYPEEADAYADRVFLKHNWDKGRHLENTELSRILTNEGASRKAGFGDSESMKLVDFRVAGDTVITRLVSSGRLANGTEARLESAAFFKIVDGKIAEVESWYDRQDAAVFLALLRLHSSAQGAK